MNQEPKFRAWIPVGPEGKPMMFYQNTQYLGSFLRRANFFASETEHDKYGLAAGKLELQQFTGILAKGAVEVYVGDLIRLNGGREKIGMIEVRIPSIYIWQHQCPDSEIEVLGNVNQNPELLK